MEQQQQQHEMRTERERERIGLHTDRKNNQAIAHLAQG